MCYFTTNYVKCLIQGTSMRIRYCMFLALAIAGCGGSSNSASDVAPPAQPPPTENSAPTISGSPEVEVTEGQSYSFVPTANDADGDDLVFSIENQPAWASFDVTSGSLTGTPSTNDIGTTVGVTISVSDGTESASLAPFDLEVLQRQSGSATVSWDLPTTNADGTDLNDLAGFNVHYGQESGNYSEVVVIYDDTATSLLIDDLEAGSWFFAVSAFDLTGNQSALSSEVSKLVNP